MPRSKSSRLIAAVDIETCPLPRRGLSDSLKKRLSKEVGSLKRWEPEKSDEALASKARSLTPFLGWICCVSVLCARGRPGDVSRGDPRSWTAGTPEEEGELLAALWQTLRGFERRTTWVTFNGKWFDSDYLAARSVRWGIPVPGGEGLLDTYPYSHRPHADLALLWDFDYSLDDLCSMLKVESPKSGFDGSMVAGAVADGEIGRVARYCEKDVAATLDCFLAARSMIGN
jgi:hypothetical protein